MFSIASINTHIRCIFCNIKRLEIQALNSKTLKIAEISRLNNLSNFCQVKKTIKTVIDYSEKEEVDLFHICDS